MSFGKTIDDLRRVIRVYEIRILKLEQLRAITGTEWSSVGNDFFNTWLKEFSLNRPQCFGLQATDEAQQWTLRLIADGTRNEWTATGEFMDAVNDLDKQQDKINLVAAFKENLRRAKKREEDPFWMDNPDVTTDEVADALKVDFEKWKANHEEKM